LIILHSDLIFNANQYGNQSFNYLFIILLTQKIKEGHGFLNSIGKEFL
jgi:hypothetical protein